MNTQSYKTGHQRPIKELCLICLQENEDENLTKCCKKHIHHECLNRWLNDRQSRGRCPHCRYGLREARGVPPGDETYEIEHRWNHPRGYIHINTGYGQCEVNVESIYPAPIIHMCSYVDMERCISDDFITSGHVIVLTNEDGEYFDILNIPPGWMLCVNNQNTTLQFSTYLQVE